MSHDDSERESDKLIRRVLLRSGTPSGLWKFRGQRTNMIVRARNRSPPGVGANVERIAANLVAIEAERWASPLTCSARTG